MRFEAKFPSSGETMSEQQLRCRECGAMYAAGPRYVCEQCFGPLEVVYDYAALARQPLRQMIEAGVPAMWRCERLRPQRAVPPIDLEPGYPPLRRPAPRGGGRRRAGGAGERAFSCGMGGSGEGCWRRPGRGPVEWKWMEPARR